VGEHKSIGCYHCDLEVAVPNLFTAKVNGELRQFCCAGCEGIATLIDGQGLSEFYSRRTAAAETAPDISSELDVFDDPQIQAQFVYHEGAIAHADLLVQGVTCTACVWLIEKILNSVEGVQRASIHSATHRLQLKFDPSIVKLSQVLSHLLRFGYQAKPWRVSDIQQSYQQEKRTALKRLGLAGIGMMQVGMIAIAVYAGDFQGIDESTRQLLNWVKAIMATPVVFYSSVPFFTSAWRALKTRHLNMDVPVALAIGGAYLASAWATLTASGEVYFDAVMMFTFFLLVGRYFEHQSRHKNLLDQWRYRAAIPNLAWRLNGARYTQVPVELIRADDRIRVLMGDQVPVDAKLLSDSAHIDESIFSGESEPIKKQAGEQVYAGSTNLGDAIVIDAMGSANESCLARTNRAADEAETNKPAWVSTADRVAAYFVLAVIIVSVATFSAWYVVAPERAFWVALSVLVATCPCALSLATPTVLAAAIKHARSLGLLVRRSASLAKLPSITEVVFDKTGTLTHGRFTLQSLQCAVGYGKDEIAPVVLALEQDSRHPIAQSLREAFEGYSIARADELREHVGLGVEALINGEQWRLGRASWALDNAESVGLVLSRNCAQVASIHLSDELRQDAFEAISDFKRAGIKVTLLSGDQQIVVDEVANKLGIDTARGNQTPVNKRQYIIERQQQGERVMMVGDGLNDIEVLAQADASVVVGEGIDLVVDRGDVLILNHRLGQLLKLFKLGERTRSVERQNICWALSYNSLILPAAALGYVAPWAAAIGMSLSSVLVVANALRVKS